MIGIPVGNAYLPAETVNSLVETCLALNDKSVPFDMQLMSGCSIVHHARSYVGHAFLKSDKNRLFMIDADMKWKADDFVKMLALTTVMDVVCGAYPAKRDDVTFMLTDKDTDQMKANDYGCLPIHGTGLGFTVVTREVMEKLAERSPMVRFGEHPEPRPYLFRCDTYNESARGEDMAFFADVIEMGYTINLDPKVSLSHIGMKTYTGSIMDAMKRIS
jgi:hypothetical protein